MSGKRPVPMRWLMPAILLATAGPVGARAQAALPSDTIVRLAVNPAAHVGRPLVMLLDEGEQRIEPDGRWVQTIRQVHQVLDAAVVRGISERAFSYARDRQSLTINWVRVLRPNGEVVSDKPAQEQEGDVPAALNNPIYQEQRLKRISLSGVAVGTIIDISWTLEERSPHRPGDFLFRWNLLSAWPTLHSRFLIDVPAAFAPRIVERNLNFRRTESLENGRKRFLWAASALPAHRPEPYEADSNSVTMSIFVANPGGWSDISRWYDSLARGRYALTPDVTGRVDSVVRASGARSRLDTVRAVHRWVAQDFRYVSVSLGIGGYQPRTPSEVLATGFGDCKDKTTLFVAALRRYRIRSDPVLLSLAGRADSRLPGVRQFDHVIAVVGDGPSRTYTDLTAEVVPFGALPESYQGSFALVVRANGTGEEVRLPQVPTDSNASIIRASFVLDTLGNIRGRVEEEARGAPAVARRMGFRQPVDSAGRAGLLRAVGDRFFPGAAVADSLVVFDGRDLSVPAVVSYHVSATNQLRTVGNNRVMPLSPFIRGNAAGYANNARTLEARPARVLPIDAGKILGMLTTITDVRVTLPPGWKAELPANVSATSFFGSYESTWTQVGDEVRLVRRIQGQRGVYPPQRIAEVITWYRTVGTDSYEFLVLTAPAGRAPENL